MMAAAHAPGAADDVRALTAQVCGPRLWWLSAAVGAQIVSLAAGFTCAVVLLTLLLAGAAIAGTGRLPLLACAAVALAAGAGVRTACFGLAGLPMPWRGLPFAYAAGQLADRLVPLPGDLGGTGTPPAAAAAAIIIYRVAGYWTLGAASATVAAVLSNAVCRGLGGCVGLEVAACVPGGGRVRDGAGLVTAWWLWS